MLLELTCAISNSLSITNMRTFKLSNSIGNYILCLPYKAVTPQAFQNKVLEWDYLTDIDIFKRENLHTGQVNCIITLTSSRNNKLNRKFLLYLWFNSKGSLVHTYSTIFYMYNIVVYVQWTEHPFSRIGSFSSEDGQIANEKQIISYFHFNYFKIQFKSSVSLFYSTYFTAAAAAAFHLIPSRASHSFPIDSLMFKSCTCSIKHGDKWEFMWKLCQCPKEWRGEEAS